MKNVAVYFCKDCFLQGFPPYTQLICLLLNHPNDYLFIRLLLTAHNCYPLLQSHTGPMLIILSTLISLLIVVGLFILEIKLSLERLWVAANTDNPGRQMNAYQTV